jgi:serine protease Do
MRLNRWAWPIAVTAALGCSTARSNATDCDPPCTDEPAVAANDAPDDAANAEVSHAVVEQVAVQDLQSAFKSAIDRAAPAVVSVYSTKTVKLGQQQTPFGPGGDPFDLFFHRPQQPPREFKQQGLGSGFVIDDQGHVLTNNHVVEGADEVKIELSDDREVDAEVIGTDPATDLALLQVKAGGLHPVELGDSDSLEIGDWVLAIGNPFGLPKTVSSGIVSAKGRVNVGIVDYENFIQTDAAVNPGNSGGPLVDLQGRVVGINTAIASRSGGNNGIAFAIPINMAKRVVDQLLDNGKVTRGHLGIMISELSDELASTFSYKGDDGILVQDVSKDSAADKAGLKNGDIITSMDGERVADVASFRNGIANTPPGETIHLEIWRDGKSMKISAKLDELPGASTTTPSQAAEPPKIGIALQDLTPKLQQQLSIEDEHGVVITAVQPGSPAAEAGIQPGDLLEQVGNTSVKTAKKALELLRAADLENGIRVRVRRNGRGHYLFLKS